MIFGISRRNSKWWIPFFIAGAMMAGIACGGDSETVVQTVIVEKIVPGDTVVQTVQVVITATPGPAMEVTAPGAPSGTLTVARPQQVG